MRNQNASPVRVAAAFMAAVVFAVPAFAQGRLSLSERIARLEQQVQGQGAGQSTVDLLNRINELQSEVQSLRGLVEQQANEIEQMKTLLRAHGLSEFGIESRGPCWPGAAPDDASHWSTAQRFGATYVLRESRQLLTGGTYYSTLGDNNPSIGDVAFRWKGTLGNTLRMGNWQHTLNLNFQSGYQDFPADVYELDATGAIVAADTVRLKVKKYFTFDWQTAYSVNKALTLTVGVKNLFDKDPPLSLRTSGAHMLGFDYRYYSPLGRTWQAKLNLSF